MWLWVWKGFVWAEDERVLDSATWERQESEEEEEEGLEPLFVDRGTNDREVEELGAAEAFFKCLFTERESWVNNLES